MHDLDRTLGRTHMETEALFEFTGEGEYEEENFEYQSEQTEDLQRSRDQ